MPAVFPNEGLNLWLSWCLTTNVLANFPWQLILFGNNIVPDQSTVWADLQQSTFVGYTPIDLPIGEWDPPALQLDQSVSKTIIGPIMWPVLSGGETVFGHAIGTSTDPVILVCEAWDPPIDLDGVVEVGVWPHIALSTQLGTPASRRARGVPSPRAVKRKGY